MILRKILWIVSNKYYTARENSDFLNVEADATHRNYCVLYD